MKVLFVTNMPVPYRMSFFRLLANEVDLTVIFEFRSSDQQYNYDYNNSNFTMMFLTDFKKRSALIKSQMKINYDHIIFGDYTTLFSSIFILKLIFKKRAYGIELDGALPKKERFFRKIIKRYLIKHSVYYFSSGKCSDDYLIKLHANPNKIVRYNFSSITDDETNELNIEQINELKALLGVSLNKTILLFVGRFVRRKGVDILLAALNEVNADFEAYIVGGEPSQEYLSIINDSVSQKVHFVNFLPDNETKKMYQICDIFILPTREDIWGLVINEAIARNCAVITTNRCAAGIELIQNNTNGIIVESENVSQLSEAIGRLLSDKDLVDTMKKNNLNTAKDWTINKMVKQHIEFFKNESSNN